jgi:hypothetical protein
VVGDDSGAADEDEDEDEDDTALMMYCYGVGGVIDGGVVNVVPLLCGAGGPACAAVG